MESGKKKELMFTGLNFEKGITMKKKYHGDILNVAVQEERKTDSKAA